MTRQGNDRSAWKQAERVRLAAERADGRPPPTAPRVAQPLRSKAEVKAARKKRERARVAANPVSRAKRNASEGRRRKRKSNERPFVGVDGEGAGTDELGRQNYMLLRAGDRELWTGQPLTTLECLEFLCDCPGSSRAILCGFSFGYDVTMILRDLPSDRRAHLLADKEQGDGLTRYTFWSGPTRQSHGYGIEYLKNNYLRVCRTVLTRVWVPPKWAEGSDLDVYRDFRREGHWELVPRPVKGSSRTIYETFGFFQSSFLKALKAWDVGTLEEREEIEANKVDRGSETWVIDQRERDYCAMECRFLAELMEKFREVCLDPAVNIRPRTWNGAGKLSSALHNEWGTMTAEKLAIRLDGLLGKDRAAFLDQTSAAYYGGRFEVTYVGDIPGPVWEYDIHSAYPAMMRSLPCLEHGTWDQVSARELAELDPWDHIFVAPLRFNHVANYPERYRMNVCGFPVRQKGGRLFWPQQGSGVYWSCEIAAAQLVGARVAYRGPGFVYRRHCECQPFPHVESLYLARKALGADMRGYPIKLAINGLYGKLAQRIGNPKFANLIWAGMITAGTRAALIRAAATDPESVVMFATDGVFSRRPLALDLGDGLGQWEGKQHGRLFIVQPGIYWGASRPKMRGVPDSVLTGHVAEFEAAWARYSEQDRAIYKGVANHGGKKANRVSKSRMGADRGSHAHRDGADFHESRISETRTPGQIIPPVVSVPIKLFTGLRIAQARGKPETAGVWTENLRRFDMAWHAKRARHIWSVPGDGDHVWTFPAPGSPDLWSRPHAGDPQLTLQLDEEKAELQEQPDAVDLSVPFAE